MKIRLCDPDKDLVRLGGMEPGDMFTFSCAAYRDRVWVVVDATTKLGLKSNLIAHPEDRVWIMDLKTSELSIASSSSQCCPVRQVTEMVFEFVVGKP